MTICTIKTVVNWNDAPKEANFFAIDEDGSGYFYEFEPEKNDCVWNNIIGGCWKVDRCFNWSETLEKRPIKEIK